jgi:hypothetical protein
MKVIALVAMIGLLSNVAFGGMIVDMRNVTQTGSAAIDPVTHTISLSSADVGDIITFQVWATVSGGASTNTVETSQMRIQETNTVGSTLEVHGNMGGVDASQGLSLTMYTSNFQGGAKPTASTNSFGDTEFASTTYPFSARDAAGPIDASQGIELGVFTYKVTSVVGTSTTPTLVSLVPKTTSAGASYYQDGTNYTGASGAYTAAASGGSWKLQTVPEPSTLVLLGMGALALLAIRRKK